MKEKAMNCYSSNEIRKLQENGVNVLDLDSVKISRDVQLEQFSPGCTLYPLFASQAPKHKSIQEPKLEQEVQSLWKTVGLEKILL